MSNPNENKNYNREVRQESHNDANGHTHVTRTNETVNNVSNPKAYGNGYVDGQVTENRYQQEVLTERDNENAGRGLLIGILLTSLAALTAGAMWYYNQRNDVDPVQTIVVPNSQPAPSPSPEARQNTTIIEKTRNVAVPVIVPQQQAPAPAPLAPAPAPDINISVPNSVTQPPATQEAPATPAPSPSESESSSTDTQSSTDTTTPAAGTSSQADTTSGSSSSGGGSTGDAGQ